MADTHVGINVPLFSLRSRNGWGVGELTDIEPFTAWLSAAGFDRLLLLPLGTMRHGETSPYSAASTLAIDPIYIGLDALADFDRAGGIAALSAAARAALDAARETTTIDYEAVRVAKSEGLIVGSSPSALRAEQQDKGRNQERTLRITSLDYALCLAALRRA